MVPFHYELVAVPVSWRHEIIPRIDWSKRNILPDKDIFTQRHLQSG